METSDDSLAQTVPSKEESQPAPAEFGAAALRKAVETALLKAATAIAEALIESAKKGHILSTRFLYDLALLEEKQAQNDADQRNLVNLADEWEADKKWFAEMAMSAKRAVNDLEE